MYYYTEILFVVLYEGWVPHTGLFAGNLPLRTLTIRDYVTNLYGSVVYFIFHIDWCCFLSLKATGRYIVSTDRNGCRFRN